MVDSSTASSAASSEEGDKECKRRVSFENIEMYEFDDDFSWCLTGCEPFALRKTVMALESYETTRRPRRTGVQLKNTAAYDDNFQTVYSPISRKDVLDELHAAIQEAMKSLEEMKGFGGRCSRGEIMTTPTALVIPSEGGLAAMAPAAHCRGSGGDEAPRMGIRRSFD